MELPSLHLPWQPTPEPYCVVVLVGNVPILKHVKTFPSLDVARLYAGEAAQMGAACIAIWHCDQECAKLEGTDCARQL